MMQMPDAILNPTSTRPSRSMHSSMGPCAGIFAGINPSIPRMLVGNGLVYLSMPSSQDIQLYFLVPVACTTTPKIIFSVTQRTRLASLSHSESAQAPRLHGQRLYQALCSQFDRSFSTFPEAWPVPALLAVL
jgi:hypothetical protein